VQSRPPKLDQIIVISTFLATVTSIVKSEGAKGGKKRATSVWD